MPSTLLRDKLQEEIDLIPENQLSDLYNVIHDFRLGTERIRKTQKDEILSFAGCWKEMDNQLFEDIMAEIAGRRSAAFLKRRNNESSAD